MKINILLPVYNEEKRVIRGVTNTYNYMEREHPNNYCITIVDNASTDKTKEIGTELESKYPTVNYVRLDKKGVGVAFREGVRLNDCEIVGYMDIDLSTDIKHLRDVMNCFLNQGVDIVNADRWGNKDNLASRKWYRRITSTGLVLLLKLSLKMKISDAISGFKFFKADVAKDLIKHSDNSENGWFFIIEILLRAEKLGYKIKEIPVVWKDDYNSTVNVVKLIKQYLSSISRLRKALKKEGLL